MTDYQFRTASLQQMREVLAVLCWHVRELQSTTTGVNYFDRCIAAILSRGSVEGKGAPAVDKYRQMVLDSVAAGWVENFYSRREVFSVACPKCANLAQPPRADCAFCGWKDSRAVEPTEARDTRVAATKAVSSEADPTIIRAALPELSPKQSTQLRGVVDWLTTGLSRAYAIDHTMFHGKFEIESDGIKHDAFALVVIDDVLAPRAEELLLTALPLCTTDLGAVPVRRYSVPDSEVDKASWCPKHQCATPCRWCANTGVIRAAEGVVLPAGEYETVAVAQSRITQPYLKAGDRFTVESSLGPVNFSGQNLYWWPVYKDTRGTCVTAVRRVEKAGEPTPELPEALARLFHETYERLAPSHGYVTRERSAVPWADVPPENKSLMVATCSEVLRALKAERNVAELELDLFRRNRELEDCRGEWRKQERRFVEENATLRTRLEAAEHVVNVATNKFIDESALAALLQRRLEAAERENHRLTSACNNVGEAIGWSFPIEKFGVAIVNLLQLKEQAEQEAARLNAKLAEAGLLLERSAVAEMRHGDRAEATIKELTEKLATYEREAKAWASITTWTTRPSLLSSAYEITPPFESEHRWLVTLTAGTVFCSAHYGETREHALLVTASWCESELAKGPKP